MPESFIDGFKRGVWTALIQLADCEWAPDQRTNLYGSGFDGTETEYLDGKPFEDEVKDWIFGVVGDLCEAYRRRGDRAPDPFRLGALFVLSRNREGTGLWDAGLGDAGNRMHEAAKSLGEITLQVSGSEDDTDTWKVQIV